MEPKTKKKIALSPAKLAANRANALKSTGPRTPEGQRRSAANARVTHGFRTREPKLSATALAEIAELEIHLTAHWQPATPQSAALVHEIAAASWRMDEILMTIDEALLNPGLNPMPTAALDRYLATAQATRRRARKALQADLHARNQTTQPDAPDSHDRSQTSSPMHRIHTTEAKPGSPMHRIHTTEAKPGSPMHRIHTTEAKPGSPIHRIHTTEAKPGSPMHRIHTTEAKPGSPMHRIHTTEAKPGSPIHRIHTTEAKPRSQIHRIRTEEPKPTPGHPPPRHRRQFPGLPAPP